MNAKKVKAIRQKLRASQINPKEARYQFKSKKNHSWVLQPSCGRAIYKSIKNGTFYA